MCSPVLAGGLAGYGAQQLSRKDKDDDKPAQVTNNYYGRTAEEAEQEATTNKNALKTGNTK
tara:strand:- start:522 stop:704 length:183 start_codon:yes stop_codon:yes gene_type:complete